MFGVFFLDPVWYYSTTRSAFSSAAAIPIHRTSCVGEDPDGLDPPAPPSTEFASSPELVDAAATPLSNPMAASVPPFLATMVRARRRLDSESPTSTAQVSRGQLACLCPHQ